MTIVNESMTSLLKIKLLRRLVLSIKSTIGVAAIAAGAFVLDAFSAFSQDSAQFDLTRMETEFKAPPREFTLLPFWFWNDELSKDKIAEQIASFEERGVYGFTIHPRIGLPQDCGWMSPKLIEMMRFALEEARKRHMYVMLYDEGMYPSGSSAGQVVAEDPSYAARGFIKVEVNTDGTPKDEKVKIESDWNYVGVYERDDGTCAAVYDAPSKGVIRGLHYLGDESKAREYSPLAADLLNPGAVDAFIRLVYQRYYDEFEEYFHNGVVVGIFTDEPSILGRGPRSGMKEGNLASLEAIDAELGYDFKPHLIELWENVDAESPVRRAQYSLAVKRALEKIYYGKISAWCKAHHTKLCGHPESSTDVGVLRQFQVPGQDIVWRYIEPGEKAFDPTHSPMAKGASSVAIHTGARRNLNEVFGAYGHEFTYDEMVWIVNWCVARGQNMFLPHAFFYSVRGPRHEERPPDVGPNSPWWDDYKTFADYCSRLCWLNTDSRSIAPTAFLVDSARSTAYGTKPLFENQLDFNYLDFQTLEELGTLSDEGVCITPKTANVPAASYKTLILTPGYAVPKECSKIVETLASQGRVVRMGGESVEIAGARFADSGNSLIAAVRESAGIDVQTVRGDSRGLRARHVVKGNVDFYFLFNEIEKPLDVTLTFGADVEGAKARWWDPWTGSIEDLQRDESAPREIKLRLASHTATVLGFER